MQLDLSVSDAEERVGGGGDLQRRAAIVEGMLFIERKLGAAGDESVQENRAGEEKAA